VHTIFAGDRREGEQSGWRQGAILAGGNYMSIDANQHIVHVETPQDRKLARSKASSLYNNANWGLVDAVEDGIVKLENLGTDTLPAEMKAMDNEVKARYVAGKAAERKKLIKKEIAVLSKARDEYVAAKAQQAAGDAASTVNDALTAAIRDQGHKKGFVSGEN
jgi:hypothetical protein